MVLDLPLFSFNPEFARPDWMIVTVMPVPPLAVRPSIMMDAASRSSDDLTYKIHDIVQVYVTLTYDVGENFLLDVYSTGMPARSLGALASAALG